MLTLVRHSGLSRQTCAVCVRPVGVRERIQLVAPARHRHQQAQTLAEPLRRRAAL
ncbi:hypothetical protein [Streptomyces sp. NPDC056061]|uniref:hypothetical protein n=1 Tax=Streptomyces sp. NPDC056061 TaxID=3345700 RepID=UPI0035DA87A1